MTQLAMTVAGSSSQTAHVVAFGATVVLSVSNTAGIDSLAWGVIGPSHSDFTPPAVVVTGKTTATITFPADTRGHDIAVIVSVTANGGRDSSGRASTQMVSTRLIGTRVYGDVVPMCVNETFERDATVGFVTILNTLAGTGTVTSTVVHEPVHAVTIRNLAAVSGGLEAPDITQYFADYDGDPSELDTGSRVLVRVQTDSSEDAIYTYESTGPRLVRSTEVVAVGHVVPVLTGRVWGGSAWLVTEALESSYVYEPQLGNPTHAAWVRVLVGELPEGSTFEDRWVSLLSIPATVLRRQNLDIELIASGVADDGTQVRYHKFACYNGNPSGAMFPVGDALGNIVNGCLDEPWIDPLVARIRARQSGGNLLIDGLRDILIDDDDPKDWRYSVEATVKIRLVGEDPPS